MASHRLPDEDRPRRAVPAWVTAPPEDVSAADSALAAGLEARPTAATSVAVVETAGSSSPAPAPAPAPAPDPQVVPALSAEGLVVPDYPPREDLLPPAPTSPAVHTVPFEGGAGAPITIVPAAPAAADAPVGTVAPAASLTVPPLAAPPVAPAPVTRTHAAPAPITPAVPVVGQPRFSVPGLEHVVVEGTEPEPEGPIGYRTPARFAHQRAAAVGAAPSAPAATASPSRSFDAVLAPPEPAAARPTLDLPPTVPIATIPAPVADVVEATGSSRTAPRTRAGRRVEREPRLQAGVDATDPRVHRAAVGATPGAVLGVLAALATLGLAAWWFTAPSTVHGVGLALGAIALLLSIVTLRNPETTWQRPIALAGVVLGAVGALGLLWAVAAALLPLVGVTLPDLTGSGTTPTLAP